jgi:DNA-directed RNA polymerase subunit RPC12/RpoP
MANLQDYKCPNCGSALAFDSGLQLMKCQYCDSTFSVEELKKLDAELDEKRNEKDEKDLEIQQNAGREWAEGETDGMRVYVCNSCGGQVIGDETLAATSCPYCGNPVVMIGQFKDDLKPDFVIPFKLDKEAAKEGLNKHIAKRKLLPNIFKDKNHIDEIKGLYVPVWLYDVDVEADNVYSATKVRTWTDAKYSYTETSFYDCFRSGTLGFENVPVDGSSKMPNDLMESIEPYDFSQAVDFQTAYLAGYLADKYDVDSIESASRANDRIKNSTVETFQNTVIGYTTVQCKSNNISVLNSNAKYALYPVWILSTTFEGENYLFAMNGQTGKFVGNLPISKSQFMLWLFIYFVIASPIVFALIYAIQGLIN